MSRDILGPQYVVSGFSRTAKEISVPVRYPKEQMHRIKYTKLTPEQIGAKLAAVNGPASVSAFSNAFAGKSLKIVLDNGPSLSYRFTGNNRLSLTEGDAAPV